MYNVNLMVYLLGMTGDALKIVIILMKDINYLVKIHEYISAENISLHGVPKISTLCPLIRTIYIYTLKYIID